MNAGYSPSDWRRIRGTLNTAGKLSLKLEEENGGTSVEDAIALSEKTEI